jgi:hypothetical protein
MKGNDAKLKRIFFLKKLKGNDVDEVKKEFKKMFLTDLTFLRGQILEGNVVIQFALDFLLRNLRTLFARLFLVRTFFG